MTQIIRIKSIDEITELAELAAECFVEDPFYRLLGGNEIRLKRKIKKLFVRSLEISLKHGYVTAHRHEGKFISMCSWVDYHYLYNPQNEMLAIYKTKRLKYKNEMYIKSSF